MAPNTLAGQRAKVAVLLPAPMATATGGLRLIELEAETVEAAVNGLVKAFPKLLPRLLNEENQIHRFVNVYLDDKDIRFLKGLNTSVQPGQQLTILSAMAGGFNLNLTSLKDIEIYARGISSMGVDKSASKKTALSPCEAAMPVRTAQPLPRLGW